MRVLLVEPACRNGTPKRRPPQNDESLWYPPLGLMKLARYHHDRGDEVKFTSGCDRSQLPDPGLFFDEDSIWDRVYITTLFTFHFKKIVDTIRFYLKAVGGTKSKIFVGGVMASLMPDDIFEATGVYPVVGTLRSSRMIGMGDDVDIDQLTPDYSVLEGFPYAVNNTFYGYATRGCTNKCPWCGVPKIEPQYAPYFDIKPMIRQLRSELSDYSLLRLMDNNVLASPQLEKIVEDLLELGYGRGQVTSTTPPRQRVIDFNQGLDATHITPATMKLIGQLNIKPMRIAFDRLKEKRTYVRAVRLARKHGVEEFSNYMLYNFRDTPRDLFERLVINNRLNQEWVEEAGDRVAGKIYSYPMRYAPIASTDGHQENRRRDIVCEVDVEKIDWGREPCWTRRFIRNIEIMKGAAHGAISPTPSLARRTIGETFHEFVENLYMPEELLRNRNKHEKRVYEYEPKRKAGTGKVEEFRAFIRQLLETRDDRFLIFHRATAPNTMAAVREELARTKDRELKRWLKLYLKE